MAKNEDFRSRRCRFQMGIEDDKEKIKAPHGMKPAIPAKPIIGYSTDRFFKKPIPKATSSPELPVISNVKKSGNITNSDQTLSFGNKSISNLETMDTCSIENMFNKPVIAIKSIAPKPHTNIVFKRNATDISSKIPPNINKLDAEECKSIPKLKLLPSKTVLGQRPKKPARPLFVDFKKLEESDDSDTYIVMKSNPDCLKQTIPRLSTSQPNLVTSSPLHKSLKSTGEEEEVYENILNFCSVKKEKSASLQNCVIPETSQTDAEEIYDDVESLSEKVKPPTENSSSKAELNILITNWRNDKNLKKMERLEKEFRKKFQFHGEIKVLTRMMADPNAIVHKPGEKDLPYTRGEILDVIQLTNTDKILCRNFEGKFGYVPRKAVLKLEKSMQSTIDAADEIYDDTELISTTFPAVPSKQRFQQSYVTRLFQRNPSQLRGKSIPGMQRKDNFKKSQNEEKEMKKKFKIEGEIQVLTRMMVVPSAGNKRGGGKDLPINKGEILEVIQFTNQEKILCRNSKGKYGYVKRRYVLEPEKEIYDDVDIISMYMNNFYILTFKMLFVFYFTYKQCILQCL
ncbi:FYN-binding protein 1-like [Spea bombifrons]|uniref:FYN-binding protein 1-like n=1 Tax=Spea bombifrons TaxID=233779 RepID=UPI00234A9A9F|nr:FYN-binding protein 1-like [Spea bombifrons]